MLLGKSRWNSFIKKKKAMESVDFGAAVDMIKDFLQSIVEKIIDNVEINTQWKSQKKGWK